MTTEQQDTPMRTAFEARMSDDGKWPQAIQRGPDGQYILQQASQAWAVWQEAWAASAVMSAATRLKPGQHVIRYNGDGEFGQATGWLHRDGGEPCAVSGKPVYVWRPLDDLLRTTGHTVSRDESA